MMGITRVDRSVEISGRQQRTITRFYGADGDVAFLAAHAREDLRCRIAGVDQDAQ